jgi:hypothetical protein
MSDFMVAAIVAGFVVLTWGLLALCDWLLGAEK